MRRGAGKADDVDDSMTLQCQPLLINFWYLDQIVAVECEQRTWLLQGIFWRR